MLEFSGKSGCCRDEKEGAVNNVINHKADRPMRYSLIDPLTVPVTIYSSNPYEDHKTISAKLLDFSQIGVKIAFPEEVVCNSDIRLTIVIDELGLQFHVIGEVCWCKPAKDEKWLAGCKINPGIPGGIFDRLVSGGIRDRRSDERSEESLYQCYRRDADGSCTRVVLQNHSSGGFCVVSESPGEVGTQFCLDLREPSPVVVTGSTQWQIETGKTYIIGCSFLDAERDRAKLISFTEFHRKDSEACVI